MKRYKVKLNENLTASSLTGLSNTTWDTSPTGSNPVSGKAATEDQLAALESKIPEMKTFSGNYDNIEVPAGTRKNVQYDVNLPTGYVIGAYKQISILNATDQGKNYGTVIIQSFSTTGGSTKANISLYNQGLEDAKVIVSVTGIAIKAT